MDGKRVAFQSIDEYIASFPADTQAILQTLRATIQAVAPDAQERISYQIPTFTLKGNLVHFAAFKTHIGFYPTSSARAAFPQELAQYEGAKGTIRFPIDQPLPLELIRTIVEFRVAENLGRAAAKSRKSAV